MYLGHRAEVCTLIAQAKLKSRTAKKSVKLIVSVLRCSHSVPPRPRPLLGDHGMAIPISSRRSIAPGRSVHVSFSVPPCSERRGQFELPMTAIQSPPKCLTAYIVRRRLQPLTSGYPSILPPRRPPPSPPSPPPPPQNEERVRRYKVVINFEQQFQQPQG